VRLRLPSRISVRLLLFNILLVFLPVAGFLYLGVYETQLLQDQERSMVQQGRLLAAALGGQGELNPAGAEVRRFGNRRLSPIAPYDSPANIAFDGDGAILLTNHAFVTGIVDPSRFNVLDVFVDDAGSPLAMPVLP